MLIFSSLRKGHGVAFPPSLSERRGEPLGRWMLAALSGVLRNMTLFIQVYLCGLYLPNKYNNGGTAVEKGGPWAGGRGEIRHPREQGALRLAGLRTAGCVTLGGGLSSRNLAHSLQVSSWTLRTKVGMEWAADTRGARPGQAAGSRDSPLRRDMLPRAPVSACQHSRPCHWGQQGAQPRPGLRTPRRRVCCWRSSLAAHGACDLFGLHLPSTRRLRLNGCPFSAKN